MPEISENELQSLIKIGVQEAKLEILVDDFKKHKELSERQLTKITTDIGRIYDITRQTPKQVEQCRRELEKDIHESYMTKTAGAMLEQRLENNIKSIKLWMVATVGGFTSAGIFILWFFKLIHI